ncbi:hypothetical protein [Burkholderia multivorans]|nr:hypothetical protein [Burkholderia multivorans]
MTDVAPPARLGVNDAWRGTDIGRQLTTHTMRFIDTMHRRKCDL